jgi:hypothetical protein
MSKDESIQEQRAREAQAAKEALPHMLEGLRANEEALTIAHAEAERTGLELKKVYRWVEYVAEEFEKRRKRHAIRGAVLLWSGFAAVVVSAALLLFGGGLSGAGWTLPAAGGVLIGAGLYIAATARRRTTVPEEFFQ